MTEKFFPEGFELNAVTQFINNEGKEVQNEKKDLFVTVGEKELPINEIGDGISALIILLFPLFINRDKNHVLFIDEPELNLHPGMQRLFLETLMKDEFKNTQVYISTHSNHLLNVSDDFVDEVNVFSFRKIDTENFEIENISKRADQALQLLGVRNSSVFTANCTIWVEGISERLYIRHLLKLYYKSDDFKKSEQPIYKEDFHYAFIEYAGSNLSHYSFYEGNDKIDYTAISRNVLVISDTDKGKEEKHEYLNKQLGDNYYKLKCREIENILTVDQLKTTVLEYGKGESPQLNDIDLSDLINERIGNIIHKLIDNQEFYSIVSKPNTKNNSTIATKSTFTKKAIDNMESWAELSTPAQNLTKKVYSFIHQVNK